MSSMHLRFALRSMARHRGYSALSIVGLAVGMTCFVLIMLWVRDELSYDGYHERADRIFRIYHHLTLGGSLRKAPAASYPMGPALEEKAPGVVRAIRFTTPYYRPVVERGEDAFLEDFVLYADAAVFEVFTWPLVAGDPATALVAPYSVVLTEETAERYFGDEDPVGQVLRFDGEEDFTVTGVVKNVPENSHFTFDMLCSVETIYARGEAPLERWGAFQTYTYLLLGNGVDPADVERTLAELVEANLGERLTAVGATIENYLQPLRSIHLRSDVDADIQGMGSITTVYLFVGIAFLVLLIACINFVNLAVARSTGRAKEIGIRKAVGASRTVLARQLLLETMVTSFTAMVLTAVLLPLATPVFSTMARRDLAVDYVAIPWLAPGLIGLALMVGFLAGGYPAFVLSSFRPVHALRRGPARGPLGSRVRGALVVTQFAVAICLTVGTVTVYRQLAYVRSADLGFDGENVLALPNPGAVDRASTEFVRNELLGVPGVLAVAAASSAPGEPVSLMNCRPEGFAEDESQFMNVVDFDADYLATMGVELVSGRNFSADLQSDWDDAALINVTAARQFGWEDPVGKTVTSRVTTPEGPKSVTKTIIGVVRDFHLSSLHSAINPLLIGNDPQKMGRLVIRMASGNTAATLESLRAKWSEIAPDRSFDHYFVKDSFLESYESEQGLANLALAFSLLALFLGCLGLFGMSAHAAERRTKEIGVRKVLGASTAGVVRLLSREFFILVAVANALAWPAAYWIMNRWLEGFAYRVQLGWATFALAGLGALTIAQATVGGQGLAAARRDPVRSLRYE